MSGINLNTSVQVTGGLVAAFGAYKTFQGVQKVKQMNAQKSEGLGGSGSTLEQTSKNFSYFNRQNAVSAGVTVVGFAAMTGVFNKYLPR